MLVFTVYVILRFYLQARYMSDISKWIDQKADDIKSFDDYNRGVISWSGMYTIASFEEFGIGLKAFEQFKVCCALADKPSECLCFAIFHF